MAVVALAVLSTTSASFATPPAAAPVNPEIAVCIKAAAATDHVALKDVDKDACECATKRLHASLKPGDYALHEQMLEVIASGADEKTFNKQMSDIMLKRGMDQHDVDAFLARSKAAEQKAQEVCNPSPLLTPDPGTPPGH
ncbi:MAG TPA: hypothetical protein VIJ85_10635 [Rhizomicrobium sp.]